MGPGAELSFLRHRRQRCWDVRNGPADTVTGRTVGKVPHLTKQLGAADLDCCAHGRQRSSRLPQTPHLNPKCCTDCLGRPAISVWAEMEHRCQTSQDGLHTTRNTTPHHTLDRQCHPPTLSRAPVHQPRHLRYAPCVRHWEAGGKPMRTTV